MGHWRAAPAGSRTCRRRPPPHSVLPHTPYNSSPTTPRVGEPHWPERSPVVGTSRGASTWDVVGLFLLKPRVPLPGAHQAHSWVLTQEEGSLQQNVQSSFPCGSPTPTQARRAEELSTTGLHHRRCADGEAGARVTRRPVDAELLTVRELPPKCRKTAVNMNHTVSVGQEFRGHASWVLAGCPSQGCRTVLVRAVVTQSPDGAGGPAGSVASVRRCGVPPPGGCHAIPTLATETHLAPRARDCRVRTAGGRDLGPQDAD